MRQIFLLILLFIVGNWLVKALRRHEANNAQRTGGAARPGGGPANGHANGHPNGRPQGAAQPAPQLPEPMIRCVECGVHLPKSESVIVAGQQFCCSAHAQRHNARPTGRDAR
jgi:uncharacterized protein